MIIIHCAKILEITPCVLEIGYFTDDVTTDRWKIDFEGKSSKSLGIGIKYWHAITIQKFSFYKKVLISNLSSNLVSIEDFKICEISKLALGPYFELFWFCTSRSKNWVWHTSWYSSICWVKNIHDVGFRMCSFNVKVPAHFQVTTAEIYPHYYVSPRL